MIRADRLLLGEIDDARATERDLFKRVQEQITRWEEIVKSARQALAASERTLSDCIGMEDASLDRLAAYDAARREVASR